MLFIYNSNLTKWPTFYLVILKGRDDTGKEFLPPSASLSVALWRPLLAEPSIEPVDKAEKWSVDKSRVKSGFEAEKQLPTNWYSPPFQLFSIHTPFYTQVLPDNNKNNSNKMYNKMQLSFQQMKTFYLLPEMGRGKVSQVILFISERKPHYPSLGRWTILKNSVALTFENSVT